MKSIQNGCSYPVIEKYTQDKSRLEALHHAEECTECLEQVIRAEHILPLSRYNHQDACKIDENRLAQLVDQYLDKKLSASKLTSEEMAQIGAVSQIYRSFHKKAPQATPSYLLNIAMSRLDAQEKEAQKTNIINNIVINIKEGVELINQSIDNLFLIPQSAEVVQVRSSSVTENDEKKNALNFYSEGEAGKKLLYYFVKENNESVMMTIKLQNYSKKPSSIAIKKEGQILNTYPVSKDYAYFSRLSAGDYEIELQYNHGTRFIESIPLKIVAE